MKVLFLIVFISSIYVPHIYGQSYSDWDTKRVEEFYEKVPVKSGTLDEEGEEISNVFVPTTIKKGIYEVTIIDYKNDLYEIKGTNYYIKFRSYVGYWGYTGKAGVLEVTSSAWSSTFYIKPT